MCNVKGSACLMIVAAVMMMFLTGCETTKHAEVMSAEELAAQARGAAGAEEPGAAEAGGLPLGGQGLSEGGLSVGQAGGEPLEGTMAAISPEGPPSPTLREGQGAISGEGGTIADKRGAEAGITEAPSQPTEAGVPPSKTDLTGAMTEYPTGNKSPPAFFGPEAPAQAYLGEAQGMEPSQPKEEAAGEAGPSGYEGQQFVQALKPSDFVPGEPPQAYLHDAEEPEPTVEAAPPSKKEETVTQPPAEEEVAESMKPLAPSDLGGASAVSSGVELGPVFFDFDKYAIRSDAVPTLQANVQLLKAKYQNSNVLIEGHCDERGTSEYNLVLGERRAQAVKNYLVDLGISSSRIQIVSYGKERPFCTQSNETCYQQNRRGHFVLQ